MTDLAAWLLEQIAEDERIARLASGPKWWLETYLNLGATPAAVWSALPPRDENLVAANGPNPHNLRHLAAWDPARVLAECAAKRRIVARHRNLSDVNCTACDASECLDFPCPTLRLLALPYADRPGYDEAWRPE